MNEKQQIINLKNVITRIQNLGITEVAELRDNAASHYDELLIALWDFCDLALHTRTHVSRSGKRSSGNAALLDSIHMTPDDVAAALLVHLVCHVDRIITMPADEAIRFLHTTVYHYCLDLVRRKKPDPIELDQPIGDGTATLIDLIRDERSDFVAAMVEEDLHQEQLQAARDVVYRLLSKMPEQPGVASALLSRLVGVKPRDMVSAVRSIGVARTVNGYIHSVCKTLNIPVPDGYDADFNSKFFYQQLLVMMKNNPDACMAVLRHFTGMPMQHLADSIRVNGVRDAILQCCQLIHRRLTASSPQEQAAMRTRLCWALTSMQLHTYDTDAACAMQISRLYHRHNDLLNPEKAS